uniref:RRM domain-containing protein n=1 Tax=Timema douglasi TaxID=61478 RepID=A0A7R8VJD6_TIMDO|nr:unnamed protein product [Timema douglasi]
MLLLRGALLRRVNWGRSAVLSSTAEDGEIERDEEQVNSEPVTTLPVTGEEQGWFGPVTTLPVTGEEQGWFGPVPALPVTGEERGADCDCDVRGAVTKEQVVISQPIPICTLSQIMNDESHPRTLYVGNLDDTVSEELVCALFSQIGSVKGCKIIREV